MLELRSVAKRLGTFELTNLDLQVRQGEYFVLLGPSGVGKTVLVELIAGLIWPDSGQLLWEGGDVTHTPAEKRGFAVVYQDCALFPHMSVARNITYGLRLPRREKMERVRAMARTVGAESLLDRYPTTLSGGEAQRVALARALVTEPQVLLLDEPLSSLDAKARRGFRAELKRIHTGTATTFLHVTHDIEEAMSLGSRVGVMLDGRMHQCGTPDELFRAPSDPQVADFLGMRNVLGVTHVGDGICQAGTHEIHVAAADESVSYIWIRPEEVLLSRTMFDSSARNQFEGTVAGWEPSGTLLAVRLDCGGMALTALVTYTSFQELGIEQGAELYATFKSSAVHCF